MPNFVEEAAFNLLLSRIIFCFETPKSFVVLVESSSSRWRLLFNNSWLLFLGIIVCELPVATTFVAVSAGARKVGAAVLDVDNDEEEDVFNELTAGGLGIRTLAFKRASTDVMDLFSGFVFFSSLTDDDVKSLLITSLLVLNLFKNEEVVGSE